MAKRRNGSKKTNAKTIVKWVAIGVGTILSIGAVTGIVTALANPATEKTLGSSAYARYILDDETGEALKEKASGLSTKSYYQLDGLKITLEEADVTYQVNYYDSDYKFMGVETYTADYQESEITSMQAQGAEYVRIEILPKNDTDGEIGIFEKGKYVDQIKVTVSLETDEK